MVTAPVALAQSLHMHCTYTAHLPLDTAISLQYHVETLQYFLQALHIYARIIADTVQM